MDTVRFRVTGLLKRNYYAQKYDGQKPEPFSFYIEAESAPEAASRARKMALLSRGRVAAIRGIEQTRLVPPEKVDPLAEAHADLDWNAPWFEQKIVAIDTETTGLEPEHDRLVEIGWSVYDAEEKSFQEPDFQFVNEGVSIPDDAKEVHGISEDDIADKPSFAEVADDLRELLSGAILVAQNRGFDVAFLQNTINRYDLNWTLGPSVCTTMLAENLNLPCKSSLAQLTSHFDVDQGEAHRAGDDAKACGDIFLKMARGCDAMRPPCTTFELVHYFDQARWPNDP